MGIHLHPQSWGIMPILFTIGSFKVSSYSFFVLFGLIVGLCIFCIEAKKDKKFNEDVFYIILAAIIGGILGAKIPIWIANYSLILKEPYNIQLLLSGRTIVGGLIGGTISVILLKRYLNIDIKMGNQFAPAIAIGLAIGRIGCFLVGCCYGKPTNLPWGVNFGDGILRHPTQLYEVIFNFSMFTYLMKLKNKVNDPAKLFYIFMNAYFSYRFLSEFIRVEQVVVLGLTGFQIACLGVLIIQNRRLIINLVKGATINGRGK